MKPTHRAAGQRRAGLTVTLAVSIVLACSASSQKPAVDAAMANDDLRRESLEATLRVLDQNPEYVDELFALTLQHPKTLDRFLQNTGRELANDALSRRTARHLADNPAGLRQILIATLDEVSDEPPALMAVAEAMKERPQPAAIAMVQREDTVRLTVGALLDEVQRNAEARRWFLLAVQDNSVPMASVIVQDGKVMASLLRAFGKVGMKVGKDELAALVEALDPD